MLEDLQNESPITDNPFSSEESRIRGYFCSNTIFNQSLRKRTRFCAYTMKINEPVLRQNIEEFCRRMQIK